MKPLSMREILTDSIDAIPVVYRGIQMRSKLEAEFAWFLDEQDFDWLYEPQVYRSDVEPGYLPDFLVYERGNHLYVEVKPNLEEANAKKDRMKAIWTVDSDATLVMVSGDGWWQATARGRAGWETWRQHWHRSWPKRRDDAAA